MLMIWQIISRKAFTLSRVCMNKYLFLIEKQRLSSRNITPRKQTNAV